jgi:hypothetical protein
MLDTGLLSGIQHRFFYPASRITPLEMIDPELLNRECWLLTPGRTLAPRPWYKTTNPVARLQDGRIDPENLTIKVKRLSGSALKN